MNNTNTFRFRPQILTAGKTATGIQIPDEIITRLGAGRKPTVRLTINGRTYRSTVAVTGRRSMVGVSAENREKAKVSGGDVVALDRQRKVRKYFEGLSHSRQRAFVAAVEGAKTAQTRQRA